jgi:hypothetical protein
VGSVNVNNTKALADMAQTAMNLATQNAVANQQHVQTIANASMENGLTLAQNMLQSGMMLGQAITTMATKNILDESIKDAVSSTKLMSSDIQDKLTTISGALAGGQQFAKIANTTPPETGFVQQLANNQALFAQQLGSMNVILQDLAAKLAAKP